MDISTPDDPTRSGRGYEPDEPTPEMIGAGVIALMPCENDEFTSAAETVAVVYRAMAARRAKQETDRPAGP
jgi:hypothetical protein